jgi:hypothetical protein
MRRQVLVLTASIVCLVGAFALPGAAKAQDEPANMARLYAACERSGGRHANNYNDWVAQQGCKCPPNYSGSGQVTCSSPADSAVTSGQSAGTMIGLAVVDIEKKAFHQLLYGAAEERARREEQDALLAEQRRIAAEKEQQRTDLMKQRILGLLKGADASSSPLGLKMEGRDVPLAVTESRDAFGSTVAVPTASGAPIRDNPLGLKLGDDPDPGGTKAKHEDDARQGFDTNGRLAGSELPPPPPTPTSSIAPVQAAEKLKAVHELLAKLKQNNSDVQALKNQLTELQKAPTPDAAAIGQVEEKLKVKEEEKNNVMENLTAMDPDDPGAQQPGGSPAAAPAPSPAPAAAAPAGPQ